MLQTRLPVASFATKNPQPQSHTRADSPAGLRFEGPAPQTPVLFGKKSNAEVKRQSAIDTAIQQAQMLMTIPVLLGVSGMSQLGMFTGDMDSEVILLTPNGERLNLIA